MGGSVKALVYRGPGDPAWTDVPDPTIVEPTDAIVRVDTATICGTDLHILHGDVPTARPGRVLGPLSSMINRLLKIPQALAVDHNQSGERAAVRRVAHR